MQAIDLYYDQIGNREQYIYGSTVWSCTSNTLNQYTSVNPSVAKYNTAIQTQLQSWIGYTWGKDLSDTLEGAGGVGGLLWQTTSAGVRAFPFYDGNGNICGYADASGVVQTRYLYDGFLNVTQTGTTSYRYQASTKSWNPALGLLEYQFRAYDPVLGRWIQEDPIEENGGLNLYCFNLNNSINQYDVLGNGGRKGKNRFPNPHPPAPAPRYPKLGNPRLGGGVELAAGLAGFLSDVNTVVLFEKAWKACQEKATDGSCDCCCSLTVDYSVGPPENPIVIVYEVKPTLNKTSCDNFELPTQFLRNASSATTVSWPYIRPLKCEYL